MVLAYSKWVALSSANGAEQERRRTAQTSVQQPDDSSPAYPSYSQQLANYVCKSIGFASALIAFAAYLLADRYFGAPIASAVRQLVAWKGHLGRTCRCLLGEPCRSATTADLSLIHI